MLNLNWDGKLCRIKQIVKGMIIKREESESNEH